MTTALEVKVETAIEWVIFPFTYEGKSFNSKVKAKTRGLQNILNLPAGVFDTMNAAALRDISTITASTTREEDIAELERINEGASWAVLELAGE
jgi:chaperonin GroEL (HSP60 family)